MLLKLNENTKKRLLEAGWFEHRNIDISKIIELYKERGFKVSEQNAIFLKEFGLLEFELKGENALFSYVNHRNFNPIKALGKNLYRDSLDYLVDEYDVPELEKVIPVGETENRNMLLLCTENNIFYEYTDGCLVKCGNTVEEMLECLVGENCMPEWID